MTDDVCVMLECIHCVSKMSLGLSCYNFDMLHKPILIILTKNVNEKVSNEKCFIFPPQLISASAVGKQEARKLLLFT